MERKKSILVFADWYEPGYKAGGPIRSCVNFVEHMKTAYSIFVFTSDRDLNDNRPYTGIATDAWIHKDENVQVYYCSPEKLNWENIYAQMKNIQADFIYLNSMFSKYFTIFPLLAGRTKEITGKIFLSPRGMLRASALRFKPIKKKFFIMAFRRLGHAKQIHFIAADDTEMNDVKHFFGSSASVSMLPNFSGNLAKGTMQVDKLKGHLSLIFVGRIHPIKNLDYLLRLLKDVKANIRLTIIGSLEDSNYWDTCKQLINELPENIFVDYSGERPNHELPAVMITHHIFVLPTQGENFGHAIAEALNAGRPVLISDQTPWKNLQHEKAGWDLPLNQPELFVSAIESAAAMNQDEYNAFAKNAFSFIKKQAEKNNLLENYKKLFS
ncbi:MAG: glycosyltransferase family 4 protein [Bacteroidetes bacterium]|nr:glycosyltransferase family 4 protein [Bacteroidota bacterium]